MTALLATFAVGLGGFWLFTAVAYGRRGLRFGSSPRPAAGSGRTAVDHWLTQAGVHDVDARAFVSVVAVLFVLGTTLGYALFLGPIPALVVGAFAASLPVSGYRHRREVRRQRAQEDWPRLIEEIRVQTASMGRSIPHAVLDVGRRGPLELRPAFEAAHREWLLTTDFARTMQVLKAHLADPTADVAAETLVIAHELGGSDVDRRLAALAEDRRRDVHDRKDARSRQAGARFARRFVLVVPGGMALAGVSIGDGRAAYQTSAGQLVVIVALALVITCWVWAGRIMRLPDPERIFR